MLFIGKDGYPVERVKGRWFLNLLRLLFHTRRIDFGERCTNCNGNGFYRCDGGFVFQCGTCESKGRVYGAAAEMVRSIRAEMEAEGND